MTEMSTLSKVVLVTAAAAASAGVVYYLFRTEEQTATSSGAGAAAPKSTVAVVEKIDTKSVTVEQLLSIMDKIIESQNQMKGVMKTINDDITTNNLTFTQAYELVREKQPSDPMEDLGIAMNDFDELLDKYQEDPRVLDAIARIMGPSDEDMASDDGKILSVKELIDIHQYMLEELVQIGAEVKRMKTPAEARTATATAQVLVGARVEGKFKITSPAVERSVMVHQNQLASNHQFATINMMMQQTMTELMGDQMLSRE